jgi:hypothetical protein
MLAILPGGSSALRRTLATLRIGNISDLADVSDYECFAMEGANVLTGNPPRMCTFFVRGHNRQQSVWALLGAAIREMENTECVEM